MEPIYRPILKRAWETAWRFKNLWFFGLFASLIGSGGLYNFNFSLDGASDRGDWLLGLRDFFNGQGVWAGALRNLLVNLDWWLVVLFLLLIVFGLFILWLAVVSQGALFFGIKDLNRGEKLSFGQIFEKGKEKFWPVLSLNVIMAIVTLALLMIVTLLFLILVFRSEISAAVASLFVAISLLILFPLGAIVTFVLRYSVIFIVNKDRSVRAAISEAGSLFKRHWLASVEMWILLWVVYIALGLVLSLIVRLILMPLLVYVFTLFANTYVGAETLMQAVVIGGLAVYMFIMLWVVAVLNVFESSCWLFLFERLNNDEAESKTARFFHAALLPPNEKKKEPLMDRPIVKKTTKKRVVKREETLE